MTAVPHDTANEAKLSTRSPGPTLGWTLRLGLRGQRSLLIFGALILMLMDPLVLLVVAYDTSGLNLYQISQFIGSLAAVPLNGLLILLMTLRQLHFLHEPAAAHFYFGLPIPRSRLLNHRLLVQLTGLVLMNLPRMLLSWVQLYLRTGPEDLVLFRVLPDLTFLVIMAAVIMHAVLFTVLSRSRSEALGYLAVFNLVWPIAVSLLTFTIGEYLPGFALQSASFLGVNRLSAVPYALMLTPMPHSFMYHQMELGAILYWAGYALVLFGLSHLLLRRRRAEDVFGGEPGRFPYPVLRYLTAISVGLASGWFLTFLSGRTDQTLLFLGAGLGALVTHLILDRIFRGRTRSTMRTLRGLGVTVLTFALLFSVLRTGAWGYPTRSGGEGPLRYVELHQSEYRLDQSGIPARVKHPELTAYFHRTVAEHAARVEAAALDPAPPEAYAPAFTDAVRALGTTAGDALWFEDVTVVQQPERGLSFFRKLSWSVGGDAPILDRIAEDPALLFWLISRDMIPPSVFVVDGQAVPLGDPEFPFKSETVFRAYQSDLNRLSHAERTALLREAPVGVLVIGDEADVPADTETARRRLAAVGAFGVWGDLGELCFFGPISERTPRTLRLLKDYMASSR